MASRCTIVIGSLISHPCGQLASGVCPRCERAACPRHLRGKEGVCVECTGDHVAPEAPVAVAMEEMMAFTDEEMGAFEQRGLLSLHTYDS